MACHKRVEDGQYKTVIKSNEKNTNQILLAQTPKRQMEKHAAGQNGQKLKAEQNGKSCSRAKWQKTKSRAKWKIIQPGKMAKTLKCSRPKRLMAINQAGQHTPSKNCSLPKARPKITQPLMQPWLFFVHPSSYRDVHRKEQQFLPASRGVHHA